MLHPGLAEVYRRKVEKLTEALNKEDLRAESGRVVAIDDPGDPAGPRGRRAGDRACGRAGGNSGADQRKKPRPFGPGAGQLTLVAGAGFGRDQHLLAVAI
jgi:hypothetical protein